MDELSLADLLAQQGATGWSGDQMIGGPAGLGRPPITTGQAALGANALKNIQGMTPAPQQLISPGGAGIAPRGPQIQLTKPQAAPADIDPRIKLGLAQLLFGGK